MRVLLRCRATDPAYVIWTLAPPDRVRGDALAGAEQQDGAAADLRGGQAADERAVVESVDWLALRGHDVDRTIRARQEPLGRSVGQQPRGGNPFDQLARGAGGSS